MDLVAPKEVSTCSYTCRRKRGGKDSAPANQNKSVLPGFQIQRGDEFILDSSPFSESENWQCNGNRPELFVSTPHKDDLTRTLSLKFLMAFVPETRVMFCAVHGQELLKCAENSQR